MWCVGLCLPGGVHRYRVFDDFEQASAYANLKAKEGDCKVFFWEL